MSNVRQYARSTIMILFALALTLRYIPANMISLYEAESGADMTGVVVALIMNGSLCLGAWMLALRASYGGARIVRICSIIKQWLGWLAVAALAIGMFAIAGEYSFTEYWEVNLLIIVLYAIILLGIAETIVEIFIARNISKMMKDIMARMSGSRPYGYLVTLDNWSIAGIVVLGLSMAAMLVSVFVLFREFAQLGLGIMDLKDMGFEYGSLLMGIVDTGIRVFTYIIFIVMSRRFCEFVYDDDAAMDAAEEAARSLPEAGGETFEDY